MLRSAPRGSSHALCECDCLWPVYRTTTKHFFRILREPELVAPLTPVSPPRVFVFCVGCGREGTHSAKPCEGAIAVAAICCCVGSGVLRAACVLGKGCVGTSE